MATLNEEVSSVRRALFPAFLSVIQQRPPSNTTGSAGGSVDVFVGDSLVSGTPQPASARCGAGAVGGHGFRRAQRQKRPRRLLGAGVASENSPAPPSRQSQVTSVLVTATTETAASTAASGVPVPPRRSSPAARRREVRASTFERVFDGKTGVGGAEPPHGGGLGAFLLIEPFTKCKQKGGDKIATDRPRSSSGMDQAQTWVDGRTAAPKHRAKRDRVAGKNKSASSPNDANDALVTLFQRRHGNNCPAVGDTLGQMNNSRETEPRSIRKAEPRAIGQREAQVAGLGVHRNAASKHRRSKTDKRRREPDSSPHTKEQPFPVLDALGHLDCQAVVGPAQGNLRAKSATNGTILQRMTNSVGGPRRNSVNAPRQRKKASTRVSSNACTEASHQKALVLAKLIKGSTDAERHHGNVRTSPIVAEEREADSPISSHERKRPRSVGGVTPAGCSSESRLAPHGSKPIKHNSEDLETNGDDAKPFDVVALSTLKRQAGRNVASPRQSGDTISNKISDKTLMQLRRTARKRKPVARFTVECFSEDEKKSMESVSAVSTSKQILEPSAPVVTIEKESAKEQKLEDLSNGVSKVSKVSPSAEGVPHAHSLEVSDRNVNEEYLESRSLRPLSQNSRNIECCESDAGSGRLPEAIARANPGRKAHDGKVAAKDDVGQLKGPLKRQRPKAVENRCFTGGATQICDDVDPSEMANEKRCSVSTLFVQGNQTALRKSTRKSTPTDRLRVGWDNKTYAECRVEKSSPRGLSKSQGFSRNACAWEDRRGKRTNTSLLVAATSDNVTNSTFSVKMCTLQKQKTRQDSPEEGLCSLARGHGADTAKSNAHSDNLVTRSESAVSQKPMNRNFSNDQAGTLCRTSQQYQPTDQSTVAKITIDPNDDTNAGNGETASVGAAGQTCSGGLKNHRLAKANSFTGSLEEVVVAKTMNHANSPQTASTSFPTVAQSLVMDLECLLPEESGIAKECVRHSSGPNAGSGSLEKRASEFDNAVGFQKTNERSRSFSAPQRLQMCTTNVSSANSLILDVERVPSTEDNAQTGREYCESINGRRSSRRTKSIDRLNVSWTKRDYYSQQEENVDARQKKVSGGGSLSKCTTQRCDPHKGETTKKAHVPAEVRRSSRTSRPTNRLSITWNDVETSTQKNIDKPKTAKAKDVREPAVKDVSSRDNDGIHKKLKDIVNRDACDTQKQPAPGNKQSPTDAQLRKKVSNVKARLQAIAKERDNHSLKADSPSGTWTNIQVNLLKSAMGIVNPTSSTFWDDVAAQVLGKTAVECRDKWFVQVKTPKARQRRIRQEKGGPRKKVEIHDKHEPSAINPSTHQHVWEEEDDIFHSTPMRNTMRVATETTNGATGAGLFVHLPCDFDSPITDSPAPQRKGSPTFDGFSPRAMSPALIRHGYKGYIKSLAKRRHMSRVAERTGTLAGGGKTVEETLLSAHVGAGDVEMKACLSPGGTMRLECPSDNDLDGMIIPPGDEFSDSEKDISDDLLSP